MKNLDFLPTNSLGKICKTIFLIDVEEEKPVGVRSMTQLEDQMSQLLTVQGQQGMLNPPMLDPSQFKEGQNGYEMPNVGSFFRISNGNVAVIALGLILSSSIGGMLSRWISTFGKWSTVIAGMAIMYFGKSKKTIRDFGVGVLLGGLANVFSGLGSQLGGSFGGLLGENPPMMETKDTYGGGDGVYPQNPDRRVFA